MNFVKAVLKAWPQREARLARQEHAVRHNLAQSSLKPQFKQEVQQRCQDEKTIILIKKTGLLTSIRIKTVLQAGGSKTAWQRVLTFC